MKCDHRCWIRGENDCDKKCDSEVFPTKENPCGWLCNTCRCTSCNQAGATMTPARQPQPQPQHYTITRAGLEEFYDAVALVNGKEYADKIWAMIERDTLATHAPAAPAMDTLGELKITQDMLYEFCEWFCDYDCEEKPCVVTISRLHERMEGIQKQMKDHPEYLAKWNAKRAEQKSLRSQQQGGERR